MHSADLRQNYLKFAFNPGQVIEEGGEQPRSAFRGHSLVPVEVPRVPGRCRRVAGRSPRRLRSLDGEAGAPRGGRLAAQLPEVAAGVGGRHRQRQRRGASGEPAEKFESFPVRHPAAGAQRLSNKWSG